MNKHQFTTIISEKGGWYLGTVADLPGANTRGRTLSEVRRNLEEAVTLILDTKLFLGTGTSRRIGTRKRQTRSVHK